jgi:hypothetical protein
MTAPGPADPALENSPFDRGLRRLRRDRAARSGAEANPLLRRIADDLLERLDIVTRRVRPRARPWLRPGPADGGLARGAACPVTSARCRRRLRPSNRRTPGAMRTDWRSKRELTT